MINHWNNISQIHISFLTIYSKGIFICKSSALCFFCLHFNFWKEYQWWSCSRLQAYRFWFLGFSVFLSGLSFSGFGFLFAVNMALNWCHTFTCSGTQILEKIFNTCNFTALPPCDKTPWNMFARHGMCLEDRTFSRSFNLHELQNSIYNFLCAYKVCTRASCSPHIQNV